VSFATDGERVVAVHLGRRVHGEGRTTPLHREAARQLRAYFDGRLHAFDLPWDVDGLPPFTATVLRAVARLPFGETLAYGEVAAATGNPRAARAVGQAVGANPLPLLVPCHRVLAAGGCLGGFGGGLAWKRWLLRHEGIAWRE